MVTEFEIRREFSRISSTDCTPMRKCRLLLRLARKVSVGTRRLLELKSALVQDCMPEQALRMHDAAKRLISLHDEIRGCARDLLVNKGSSMYDLRQLRAAYADSATGKFTFMEALG